MIHNGETRHSRLLAFLLTVMLLINTCFTPAMAANVWDELVLNIHWTDGAGKSHTATAEPVPDVVDRAYWVSLDAAALGQTLTVEALCSDPAYSFYLLDGWGNRTTSFTWLPEMDALSTGYEYAYMLLYAVNDVQADIPVLLFVSSSSMPAEEEFQPYPVQVPVYYVTEDGVLLDTQYVECWAGENTPVWAGSLNTEGYALLGSDSVNVYVDQSGFATPGEVTFTYRQLATPTPEPTDVPTPTPVAEVPVPVVYVHVNGEQLDFQEVFLAPGSHEIYANSARVDGYQPVGDTRVTITIYPDGSSDLASVVFYYDDVKPAEAVIPVYYYHEDGTLLDMQEITLPEGNHTITPNSAKVEGLELDGASAVDVTVYSDGSASIAYVAFTYKTPYVAPAEAIIPVYYYHEDGTLLDMQELTLPEGNHTIMPNSAKVEGLELDGTSSVDVTVYSDGSSSIAYVAFTYKTPYVAPAEAVIPVYYYHEDGTLLDMQELTLPEGTHTITPNSAKVEGLELDGTSAVDVTVYADGSASIAYVAFTYKTPYVAPAEAAIPVYYYHEDGTLLDMQELTLPEGTHTITPNSAKVEGLELDGTSAVDVIVYADGSASIAYVAFTYKTPYVAPAEAVIPVYYYHEDGTLLDMQELTLPEGTHTITPNSAKVEGLELDGTSAVDVTVYSDGSASIAYVAFTYKTPYVAPAEAAIPVYYYHTVQGLLDSQTILLTEGTHVIAATSSKTAGYVPVGNTEVEITVYPDGSTSLAAVEFYYEDAYVAPVTAELTILYQLGDSIVAHDGVTLAPGTHTILPDETKAGGYVLDGDQSHVVVVDGNGVLTPEVVSFYVHYAAATVTVHYQDDRGRDVAPAQTYTYGDGSYVITAAPEGLSADYELAPGQNSEVTVEVVGGVPSQTDVYFYYQPKQVVSTVASVTVHYLDTYGNQIAAPHTVTLTTGQHQLNATATDLPEGAELVSDEYVTVEVFENGTYSPQEVAFYYLVLKEEEQTATVTVYYRDDRGNDVAPSETHSLGNGTHVIEAKPVGLPEGYVIFAGTDTAVEITVRNGVASKNQVVFYYQKTKTEPTVFTLPVNYYDTEGKVIATPQTIEVGAGTWAVQANPADLPEGYELAMDPVLTVIVHEDGTTKPEEIAFYYRAPEKKATIIVNYLDQGNRSIIEPFTVELSPGYHTLEADAALVPSGYDPASAKPVQVYVSREGEANPAQVTFVFEQLVVETPIPVGEFVYRYANVNDNDVAFRSEPSTDRRDTVIKRVKKNSKVYVMQELHNDKNEVWAMVNIDGRIGYIRSDLLDIMTQARSDEYAAGSTAVPTFTPVPTPTPTPTQEPTATPTEIPTPTPTQAPSSNPTVEITQAPVELISPPPTETPTLEPLPSETPTEAPTATPTVSPSPTPYSGYALTTRATALRTGISASDMTIMQSLEANELVQVIDQRPDPVTGEIWSIVSTMNRQAGFVQDSALRRISDKDAEPYIDLWVEQNKTPEPTVYVSPTPEPMQLQGYGVVLGDDVPFRQMASEFSRIIDNLAAGTIVYITGQTPGDNQYWHSVNYNGYWGYIRTDLVRMMTIAEEEAYIESQQATPTPATSNQPFDEDGMSSYGYVDGSTVNWREAPSTNAKKVGELKRYALCLVTGSEYVNGVTWYKVSYDGKTGYLHGDFFKQMTISELEDFLGSENYLAGVANNSASGDAAMDDVGFTGPGGIVSAEDQWVSNNPDVYVSFEPFNPIATIAPIQTMPTLEPLPGLTPVPTATASPTPTFNPLPDVTYPTTDDGKGGSAVMWLVVAALLLLTVGGVFALVRYQQNRRRIAMRAAQRRAQAARAQQQQQRPYARTTANQPRTGTYPNQQTSVRRPVQPQQTDSAAPTQSAPQATSQYAPYSGSSSYGTGSYYRPKATAPVESEFTPEEAPAFTPEEDATQPVPRVGRRTAYRQAQEEQNPDNSGNPLDM